MKKNIYGMIVSYKKADLSNMGVCGYFDTRRKEIVIDKKLKGDDLKITRLHEEFEAVFFRTTGHQVDMSNDAKEIMIDAFATFVVENYTLREKRK